MNMSIQQTKFDKANRMVSLLVDHATGKPAESSEYEVLRKELLADIEVAKLIPSFVRKNRNLSSFWAFISLSFLRMQNVEPTCQKSSLRYLTFWSSTLRLPHLSVIQQRMK